MIMKPNTRISDINTILIKKDLLTAIRNLDSNKNGKVITINTYARNQSLINVK